MKNPFRMRKQRCRHERNSWLIAGGYIEWCFACGAWRQLIQIGGKLHSAEKGKWYKPSGDPKVNPWKASDR
jgi:hypothetical protein